MKGVEGGRKRPKRPIRPAKTGHSRQLKIFSKSPIEKNSPPKIFFQEKFRHVRRLLPIAFPPGRPVS